MTVNELTQSPDFEVIALPDPERKITGVYCGDLLSWVMGRANSGDAWITIMSNVNILAVATLTDCALIILAEGITLDENTVKTANEKCINIVSTNMDMYEAAVFMSKNL